MARNNVLFALLALATVSAGAFGRDLLQSPTTVRWVVPANGIKPNETVSVGGSITFTWTSTHDLWEIPSASCPSAFANGTGITQLAARSSGGSRVVEFPRAGTRYFSCSVSTHCQEGQLMTVKVGSAAPAPGPSRYGVSYGGGSTCGPNSTSGSGYGGSSGSGSNYTGNSTYGGGTPSIATPSAANTSTTTASGSASYGGGGASYGGGSSTNYGSGRKLLAPTRAPAPAPGPSRYAENYGGRSLLATANATAPAPGPSRYGMSYGGGSTCGPNTTTASSGYGGTSGSGGNGTSSYGGGTPSTPTTVTTSSFGGGSASYGGGGANYGGGSSTNYGSGRKH